MLRRYTSGAWTDVEDLKRYSGGSWADCESAKRYADGTWVEVWSSAEQIPATFQCYTNYYGAYSYTPSGTACSVQINSLYESLTVSGYIKIMFPRNLYRPTITFSMKGEKSLLHAPADAGEENIRGLIEVYVRNAETSSRTMGHTSYPAAGTEPLDITAGFNTTTNYYNCCEIALYVYGKSLGGNSYSLPSLKLDIDEILLTLNGTKYRASFE